MCDSIFYFWVAWFRANNRNRELRACNATVRDQSEVISQSNRVSLSRFNFQECGRSEYYRRSWTKSWLYVSPDRLTSTKSWNYQKGSTGDTTICHRHITRGWRWTSSLLCLLILATSSWVWLRVPLLMTKGHPSAERDGLCRSFADKAFLANCLEPWTSSCENIIRAFVANGSRVKIRELSFRGQTCTVGYFEFLHHKENRS